RARGSGEGGEGVRAGGDAGKEGGGPRKLRKTASLRVNGGKGDGGIWGDILGSRANSSTTTTTSSTTASVALAAATPINFVPKLTAPARTASEPTPRPE